MPFSLQNTLNDLITASIYIFPHLWLSVCISLFFVLLYFLISSVNFEQQPFFSDKKFITLGALTIIVCRLPSLIYGETNPDESQWLATAITLHKEPYLYFKNFYVYDFGRILTIAPLWIMGMIGFNIDYGLSKLVGIFCWIIFLLFYYLFIKNLFGKKTALISGSILTVFLATFSQYDFISYNSETPAVMLLSIFLFLYHKSIQPKPNLLTPFIAGFLLASVFFAKEQAAYIVVTCGLLACLGYFYQKQYRNFILFILGSLSSTIFFILPIIIFGNAEEFIQLIKQISSYSANGLNYNNLSWIEKLFSIKQNSKTSFYFMIIVLFLLCCIIGSPVRKIINSSHKTRLLAVQFLCFFGVSFFTVLSPSDFFNHYTLFLVLPIFCLLSITIHLIGKFSHKYLATTLFLVLFLITSIPGLKSSYQQLDWHTNLVRINPSPLLKKISSYTKPGDKMLVWGWDCQLYVKIGLIRSSRYWYPQFLHPMYPIKIRTSVEKKYVEDINKYKPDIIVDLPSTGKKVAFNIPKMKSHSSIQTIIKENYTLVYEINSKRIYLKNEY